MQFQKFQRLIYTVCIIQYINLIIKDFRRLFVVPNKQFVRKMSFSALTGKLKTVF